MKLLDIKLVIGSADSSLAAHDESAEFSVFRLASLSDGFTAAFVKSEPRFFQV